MLYAELKRFIHKAYEIGLSPDQATVLFQMVEPDPVRLVRAIVEVRKEEVNVNGNS